MNTNTQPIGVFDSGVGGLTVLSKLHSLLPNENFVYVGDTKRNPYGPRTIEEIQQFTAEILSYLESQHVKLAAIACNTMTAVAPSVYMDYGPYPVIGMSKGLHTAMDSSSNKKIAVFATLATIHSHCHKIYAAAMDPEITVIEQACPKLAALIEHGVLSGNEIMEALQGYVKPAIEAGADTAIFGCTHYPFIVNLFEQACSHMVFVDPAHETSLDVLEQLKKDDALNTSEEPGTVRLCFTAEPERGERLAEYLLADHDFTVEEISLT